MLPLPPQLAWWLPLFCGARAALGRSPMRAFAEHSRRLGVRVSMHAAQSAQFLHTVVHGANLAAAVC